MRELEFVTLADAELMGLEVLRVSAIMLQTCQKRKDLQRACGYDSEFAYIDYNTYPCFNRYGSLEPQHKDIDHGL